MSDIAKFMNNFKNSVGKTTHTSLLAKVISYNAAKLQATVQPLASSDGLAYPQLTNLPVSHMGNSSFIVHIPLSAGDIVLVDICEHDIDNITLGKTSTNVNTDRNHELDDAVVVGKITPFNSVSLPNTSDIYIGDQSGTTYITLSSSGTITIEAGTVKLGSGASEGVPLGDSLKTWLDSHTHSDDGAGTPTTDSPDPSTKVSVE